MSSEDLVVLVERFISTKLTHEERIAAKNRFLELAKNSKAEIAQILKTEKRLVFLIEILQLLGATNEPFFEAEIQKILQTNQNPAVLQTAATTLGKLGNENSFTTLVQLLESKNANVRIGAIYGLINLGKKEAVKYLKDLLDDQTAVKCWCPYPKPGGYYIHKEAAIAIDFLTGQDFKGDKEQITAWLGENSTEKN